MQIGIFVLIFTQDSFESGNILGITLDKVDCT
jgi:hypothetical protein